MLKKNKITQALTLTFASLSSTIFHVPTAFSQDGVNKADIEVIEVTAQRKVQNLQDTPVSISAISADSLKKKGIDRLDEISYAVPNLVIAPNTGTSSGAKIFMRGVGEDNSTFTNDPAIGIYVDGVFLARQTGALVDIYDVERVEVLRGPQGTLYGRNTSGGAIKYISKKPQGKNESYVQVNVGNYGRLDTKFAGDFALTDDLAVQVALLKRDRDGISENLTTGKKVNDQDVFAARIGALWQINEYSSLYLNADIAQDDSTAGFASNIISDEDDDLYTLESAVTGPNEVDQTGFNITYNHQFDNSINLEVIAAHRTLENPWHGDFDAKEAVVLEDRWELDQEQTSLEIQLSATNDNFDWVVGAFIFSEDNELSENVDVLPMFLGPSPNNDFNQKTDSLAFFLHGSYKLTDALNVTAGIRQTSDDKDIRVKQTLADGTPSFTTTDDHSWDNQSIKLGLDYRASDNALLFANIATGYKSGGYTLLNNGELRTFDEETNITYEVGVKSDWLENRLRLNGTVFFSKYDDLQLSAWDDDGNTVRLNAADTEISGLELELTAAITSNWQLNASLSTLDAEYKEARAPIETSLDLKQAPELRWSLGSVYYIETSYGEFNWSLNASYTDDYFQNVANSPNGATDSHTLINSRLEFTNTQGNLTLGIWGKNLSDEEYATGSLIIEGLGIAALYMNVPRTYGVDLTYRF